MATLKVPKVVQDFFTPAQWKELKPEDRMIVASGAWQDSANFGTNAITIDETINLFPYPTNGYKATHTNWRALQKKGWQAYKGFGPLRAAIDAKSDFITKDLEPYSRDHVLDAFVKDIWYSPRNQMYNRVPSWMIRMMAEVELFALIVFDDEGNVTIRNLEPTNIGKSNTDTGLISDPDDVSTTLFYLHKGPNGDELIPDARFILDTDFMLERMQALGKNLDTSLIDKKLTMSSKHRELGGFRRFVLHWRNLTGEMNVPRDTSAISAILEFINLFIMTMKWEIDYKKSLCAYTIIIGFTDTPAGKLAWHLWSKMTPEQKAATNLTKPLSPGSKVFILPGMTIDIKAPQLPKLSGSNDDLLFMTGSGARAPQDLWMGSSSGATHASLKASRHPLMTEIETLQSKLDQFLRFQLLRCCITAKLKMGGAFTPYSWLGKKGSTGGEQLQLEEAYTKSWPESIKDKTYSQKTCEPIEKIGFKFPPVKLGTDANMGTLFFGSKNSGLHGAGISLKTIAGMAGVNGLEKELMDHAVEIEEFGEPKEAPDQNTGATQGNQPKTDGGTAEDDTTEQTR